MDKNDLISRAAAIAWFFRPYSNEESYSNLDVERALKSIPAVNAVSVVRCKDCKHRPIDRREEYNEMTGFGLEFPDSYCPCQCDDGWYNWFPGDDWYCANGERRHDEDGPV